MNSEVLAILAILSPIAAIMFGVIAMRRGQKTDDTSSGREIGALLSDVGYVKSSVDGIARKLEAHDDRFTAMAERISAVETSTEKAHQRIDVIVK